jgi:hypothetical protein
MRPYASVFSHLFAIISLMQRYYEVYITRGSKWPMILQKKRRQQLRLPRRTDDPEALRIQEAHMQLAIRQEIHNGKIEGYSRGLLHTHIRQMGHLLPR